MSLLYIFILIHFLINETVNVAINETVNVAINETVNVAINETVNVALNETVNAVNKTNDVLSNDIAKEHANDNDYTSDSDDKYQLRKLHSSPSAQIFLEGCTDLYSSTQASNASENGERYIKLDNADRLIIMGIFTLHQLSILLYFDNPFENSQNQSYVNITLGINRNSAASIQGYGNLTGFGNGTVIDDNNIVGSYNGETLPALPYYIAINTTNPDGEVQVAELRLKKHDTQNDPFLRYKYADNSSKAQFFRIDHAGPIYAHYSCCELDCKRQTFHRISGCNKYSTRSSKTERRTDLTYYYKGVKDKKDKKDKKDSYIFNGAFFIEYPKNTPLAVKFTFFDLERNGDYYVVVLTDTYAAIHQHIYKENTTYNETSSFAPETFYPMTVNITITKSGVVSLTRTYESRPYKIYRIKNLGNDPVTLKSMSMSKLYNDEIRYDFYYNCSDVLTYFNETTRSDTTKVMNKRVERFNETRYDLVKIFNDTFSLDLRYGNYYNDEFKEFEDIEFIEEEQKNLNSEDKLPPSLIKVLTGACSFLFIGILKYFSGLKCVKNFTQDVIDDEKVKKYRENMSAKFDTHMGSFFGDE